MLNPFQEFRAYTLPRRELPLDRILAQRDAVLERLLQSYQALVEEESKQLVWVVEQGALSRAYTTAVEALRGVVFSVEDIEDMCLELDAGDGVATPLGAPSGLFIAALCNQVQANEISLNLHAFTHRWPFLGYRLARGRRLHLDGNAGDFVGALLEGGEVIVTGNVGNYAGVGMKSGLVHVRHSTGKYTGEGMRGGVLRVDGHIGSLGKASKGTIHEGGRQVFPADTPARQTARSAKRD